MSLKFDVTSPPKLLNPQQKKNDTTGKNKSRSCDAYYFDNENSKGGPQIKIIWGENYSSDLSR